LEKQKDPNIMTEPFLVKIQELKTEMRDKDEHISALNNSSIILIVNKLIFQFLELVF
jgi:hypothetical protein